MKTVSVEKKLVHKLVEECTETNNKIKLAKKKVYVKTKISINAVLAHCTLYYFR